MRKSFFHVNFLRTTYSNTNFSPMRKSNKSQKLNYDNLTGKYLNQIQISLLIISILSICLAIYLIYSYSSIEGEIEINKILQILLNFLVVVFSIYLSRFLNVSLKFVEDISNSFDFIKNDIAISATYDPKKLCEELNKFFTTNFNFPFLNIKYSFIKLKDFPHDYSDINLLPLLTNKLTDITAKSKKTQHLFFYDKYLFNNGKYYLYVLPIWFNGQWSGHIGMFTKENISNRHLVALLHNFENHVLDDLIEMTLKNYDRYMLREIIKNIDMFSNKITNREYKDILEYQNEVITYLVNRLDLLGGIFISSYSTGCGSFFNSNKITRKNEIIKYLSDKEVISSEVIYSDPDIPQYELIQYIFCIPIIIKNISGVIYLFDITKEKLESNFEILSDLEDFKLDNDIEYLKDVLKLKQVRTF